MAETQNLEADGGRPSRGHPRKDGRSGPGSRPRPRRSAASAPPARPAPRTTVRCQRGPCPSTCSARTMCRSLVANYRRRTLTAASPVTSSGICRRTRSRRCVGRARADPERGQRRACLAAIDAAAARHGRHGAGRPCWRVNIGERGQSRVGRGRRNSSGPAFGGCRRQRSTSVCAA